MFEKFLGLPLADVVLLLEESNIPYRVLGETEETEADIRVIRIQLAQDGILELLTDGFKTTV